MHYRYLLLWLGCFLTLGPALAQPKPPTVMFLTEAYPGKWLNKEANLETSLSSAPQLYDLGADPGQPHNLAAAEPAQLAGPQRQLKQVVGD